jgi:hypothetical protein
MLDGTSKKWSRYRAELKPVRKQPKNKQASYGRKKKKIYKEVRYHVDIKWRG